MTLADGGLIAAMALAGWLGWRQGLPAWAPFTLGFCVSVVLLRGVSDRAEGWASAQMYAGVPRPSHLYVLRTSSAAQFAVRLGGAWVLGAVCQRLTRARRTLWCDALSEVPFATVSRVAAALDAMMVTCVLGCAMAALLANAVISGWIGTAVVHSAVVAPLARFLGLGLA